MRERERGEKQEAQTDTFLLLLFSSGKSELTLEDVLHVLNEPWAGANNDRDALRQALGKFDDAQEGYIDTERFRTVMTTLGEPLDDDELEALIQLGSNEDQTKISIECKTFFVFICNSSLSLSPSFILDLLDQLIGPVA